MLRIVTKGELHARTFIIERILFVSSARNFSEYKASVHVTYVN